jgi:hypothetical protein
MTRHRLVTWPWLRRVGRIVLRDWLAITIGHTVFAWRALSDDELEHELEHVRQWARLGLRYPLAYLAASLRARMAGGQWYRDNRYEVEARAAAATAKRSRA